MEKNKSLKPMHISEMLPALRGVMSKENFQMYTQQNKPRLTNVPTRSNEKTYKPLTMAELSSVIHGLNSQSSRKPAQATSSRKKKWNTSVKVVHKNISHTAKGQMRDNPVRKVLDMASNPKIPSTRNIPVNSEASKFPKPEYKAKKSFSLRDRNNVRISGICAMPETPIVNKSTKISRQTVVNKENVPIVQPKSYIVTTPASTKVSAQKKFITPIIDTPLLKETWISSCDDSFLQREKEIQDIEEVTNGICEEQALVTVAEMRPSMSTPFKNLTCATNLFNDCTRFENSLSHEDDSIIYLDKPSNNDNEREETIILSLCNLLTKTNLNNSKSESTEFSDLVEFQKQSKLKIEMIEQSIETLNKIKQTELKSLETVTKLIEEKFYTQTGVDNMKNLNNTKSVMLRKPCSIIVTSPKCASYRIPKKNSSLRKSIVSKSVPNVSNLQLSPHKGMNEKALSMYLKMKKHVTFLNTPVKSVRKPVVLGTPSATVTSLNLQKQLDKLYTE